jgi:hypothetical protein
MAPNPYPQDTFYSSIVISYKNEMLIADEASQYVPVGKREFRYLKHKLEEGLTIPNTNAGRTSELNEALFSAEEATGYVEDYGLQHPLPQDDIDNAPQGFDPRAHAAEMLMRLILLDREKRVADLFFNSASYAAGQTVTLSGTDQFSDFTNSDPQGVIDDVLDVPPLRPNVLIFGRSVWTKFRRHPGIVEAVRSTGSTAGTVTRQEVADLFEVQKVLVGEGWLNTAKPGQAISRSRVWGKHIAAIYQENMAASSMGTAFSFTARFKDRVASAEPDRRIGLRGGERIRVGESVKEVIAAPDLGYFIQNAIA